MLVRLAATAVLLCSALAVSTAQPLNGQTPGETPAVSQSPAPPAPPAGPRLQAEFPRYEPVVQADSTAVATAVAADRTTITISTVALVVIIVLVLLLIAD